MRAGSKNPSDPPLVSKCGTLKWPCSVGMRSSVSGTRSRVSSSVDQMMCLTALALVASARFLAWEISFSGDMLSQ